MGSEILEFARPIGRAWIETIETIERLKLRVWCRDAIMGAMTTTPILFFKGGPGSGNHHHAGVPGHVGGSAPQDVATSADIATEPQAAAYWAKHFADGNSHRIACKYGKRKYPFQVRFERNHAYTEDAHGTGRDKDRTFALDRAQGMDAIWRVLEAPDAVTWSRSKPGSKQFDKLLSLDAGAYGRVILEPEPTPEDIAGGKITHFVFVSWHPVGRAQFAAARHAAARPHVNPLQTRKALPFGGALQSRATVRLPDSSRGAETKSAGPPGVGLGLVRGSPQAAPDSEGIPFDWTACFQDNHYRKAFASDWQTDCVDEYSADDLILKADIPAGARWITVKPNGPGTKGTPLLIQETSPGSGVSHVIGGAGGKLNYLRLHASQRSPAEAHLDAVDRQNARAEAKKIQRAKETSNGTRKAKQLDRQTVDSERRSKEDDFIDYMAGALGWKGHKFKPEDHPGLSDKALEAAGRKHHKEWMAKAVKAANHYKQVLLNDDDARAQALGHDPLVAGDTPLDTSDIGLRPTIKAQLGAYIDYSREAQKQGASEEAIATEAAATATAPSEATGKRKATGEDIAKELEGFRSGADTAPLTTEDPAAPKIDTDAILGMARAQKVMKEARKAAVKAKGQIDSDAEPKGAYHLQVSEVGLDDVRADLLNDLRTASTRAFLSEVNDRYGDKADATLGMSMVDGAHGAINALSLTVAGDGLMDKTVVDALGIAGAAQILARKLKGQLSSEELDDLRGAMADYHTDHYLKATEATLKEARDLEAAAKAIDIEDAATGADLATLKTLNNQRAEATAQAQRLLGRTLGEMEANAALVQALGENQGAERLSLPIGQMSREDAITRARAIGLDPGDYQIHSVGQAQYLDVSGPGMDRLTAPVKREDLERYRESRAILTGERDEQGWLPKGVANRPDLAMDGLQPGVVPQLAEPFAPASGADLPQAIQDYIGGRTADGDAPADIVADLNSQALADKSGDAGAYWDALDAAVPRAGKDGKPLLADAHKDQFEALADDFVKRRYGATRAPFQRQQVAVNPNTLDVLHRTLAEVPEGAAAYKPIGDLTHEERRGLRQWWEANVGAKDARGKELAGELKAIEDREPPKTAPSLFGDDEPNPDHADWQRERDAKAAQLSQSGLSWPRYVEGMGSPEAATAAVQDLVRGEVSKRFADLHNRIDPGEPLKLGRESIRGGLDHLDLTDPKAREERQRKQRDLVDDLRARDQGKYAAGTVADKLSAAAQSRAAESQAQVDMFGFADPAGAEAADAPLKGDQRYSLGHAAERQLAGLMQHVGQNFRPGDKIKIWAPSMDGDKALGQRAIKFIEANKHVAMALGTGTGKSLAGLGAFTDLHAQGKVHKGLFVVPSSVQGQMHGEALRYLEPGKFKWHAKPGATREERLAAMRDPDTHFSVVTHQALRDDLLHLGAEAAGVEPDAMAKQVDAMTPGQRKAWAHKVMADAGIQPDFLLVDESQVGLNRQGKDNSAMANVLDAVGHNAAYHVRASADAAVKNDVSETFALLQSLDPEKYSDRDAFLRKYGGDTLAKKDALRREMTPYMITGRIDPDVKVTRSERSVALNDKQTAAIKEIQQHIAAARLGRIKGKPDVAALKALSPDAFEGVPEAQQAAVAKRLQASLGVIQESAMRSAIDDRGQSAKLDETMKVVAERKGKPGVIFVNSLAVAKDLHERLAASGHRVGMLTGANSAKERGDIIQGFNPESGEAKTDILIMSNAGAVGINAQRGQWMMQYDTPLTPLVHAQREGRINRQGQKNGVELIDLVGDHPHEHKARARLRDKYGLREMMTDPAAGLDDSGLGQFLASRQQNRELGQGGLF